MILLRQTLELREVAEGVVLKIFQVRQGLQVAEITLELTAHPLQGFRVVAAGDVAAGLFHIELRLHQRFEADAAKIFGDGAAVAVAQGLCRLGDGGAGEFEPAQQGKDLGLQRLIDRFRHALRIPGPDFRRQVAQTQDRTLFPLSQEGGAAHRILQLPHIARPAVDAQHLHHLVRDGIHSAGGMFFQEIVRQEGNVFRAFAQRRKRNGKAVQAVVKIAAEGTAADLLLQIAVAGGNNPHIHFNGLFAADPFEAAFLEHAQQSGLERRGGFGDLVEEDGAAVGQLEAAPPARLCSGEGAFFVPEEFAFQQIFRQCPTVDGNERPSLTSAGVMDRPGDHLFAGTGFSHNQHRNVTAPDARNQFQHLAHAPFRRVDDAGHLRRGGGFFRDDIFLKIAQLVLQLAHGVFCRCRLAAVFLGICRLGL